MDCDNDHALDDARERLIALGYNLNPKTIIYLDPKGHEHVLARNGGMINVVRTELRCDTQIFKYTDARQPPDTYLSSGWWFDRASLDRVIAFADHNKIPQGYAVRLLGCVPPEWGSNLDLVVRARLTHNLAAFSGLARSAHGTDAKGTTFIAARNDIAAWRLRQLYIPGLRDPLNGQPTRKHHQWLKREATWPVANAYNWIYLTTR